MTYQIAGKLTLDLPVFQAPMGGTATPQLAAAVCEAGGLGGLGLVGCSVQEAATLIDETAARTSHAFNVNFFCHQQRNCTPALGRGWIESAGPLFKKLGVQAPETLQESFGSFIGDSAMLAMLLEKRPRVISFHCGLPHQQQLSAVLTQSPPLSVVYQFRLKLQEIWAKSTATQNACPFRERVTLASARVLIRTSYSLN